MHRSVSFNFSLLDSQNTSFSALAPASLYGKGIFTTLAIHDLQPFLWQKHWRRLKENSSRVGIDLSEFTEDKLKDALGALIDANGVKNGRARITFFDESASGLWPHESERTTSLLIMTSDFGPRVPEPLLTTSPYRVNSSSPLAGVKSCNYLEKLIARDEAKHRGFDEAVQLNERGEIASACMANIFWLKDEMMFTPSSSTGCLPGTTREFILENMDCEEVEEGIDELQAADEIFLTSAGVGVVQAAKFEGRALDGDRHAITELVPSRI